MSVQDPLTGLSGLSRPVNTLIVKIANAAGVLFEPTRMIRKARAEAKVREIEVISRLELEDLQKRTLIRFIGEETKKQENIESVVSKALQQLKETADPDKIENDWISLFFDKIKLVSDEDMQALWARILSGEANTPGSFSKRTLTVLSSLDKRDATLFTELCSFAIVLQNVIVPIYDVQAPIYTSRGINFTSLTHLDGLGLLKFDNLAGFRRLQLPAATFIDYHGYTVWMKFQGESDNSLDIGKVLLLQPGQELAPVCDCHGKPEILEYFMSNWIARGVSLWTGTERMEVT